MSYIWEIGVCMMGVTRWILTRIMDTQSVVWVSALTQMLSSELPLPARSGLATIFQCDEAQGGHPLAQRSAVNLTPTKTKKFASLNRMFKSFIWIRAEMLGQQVAKGCTPSTEGMRPSGILPSFPPPEKKKKKGKREKGKEIKEKKIQYGKS